MTKQENVNQSLFYFDTGYRKSFFSKNKIKTKAVLGEVGAELTVQCRWAAWAKESKRRKPVKFPEIRGLAGRRKAESFALPVKLCYNESADLTH